MIRANPDRDDGPAFNDAGEVEPSVGFDYTAVEANLGEPPARKEDGRDETAIRILQFLSAGNADAKEIGVRVLLLSHVVRPDGTQAQLAARTGLTTARISQRIASIRERLRLGALTFSD